VKNQANVIIAELVNAEARKSRLASIKSDSNPLKNIPNDIKVKGEF
jgi:hypothetical protein